MSKKTEDSQEKNEPAQIEIRASGETWMMRFTPKGIFFNHEAYPLATPHDFAVAFIEIMEKNYDIKFIQKTAEERNDR